MSCPDVAFYAELIHGPLSQRGSKEGGGGGVLTFYLLQNVLGRARFYGGFSVGGDFLLKPRV